jgi:hypothetical protein
MGSDIHICRPDPEDKRPLFAEMFCGILSLTLRYVPRVIITDKLKATGRPSAKSCGPIAQHFRP